MPADLDTIVCHVRDLPGDERSAYLDKTCAGDCELRARVDEKLAELQRADEFFNAGKTIVKPASQVKEQEGALIGPYKLLQQIGEGGFGTVWMAEQQQPVRRRVALKIIKAGMDTREVVARFEQERQALAMMDHPNIAQVFDAGATESGRPYFVMELVKGIPVTTFCDQQRLGTRDRLRLFADVCSAINHAHQKGVIHRDIKPSNVMVTLHGGKAVPKVIDFGIAKATQSPLTDKTLFTRFEQFVGTPVYMSPEQAALSGLDIDTRSDIYALGILLYELLTGRPPFDAQSLVSAGYDEMRRIIREVEPPRPSSRLSTVVGDERTALALARQISPDKISRLVEPDLDWIVMKAIEKDRTRRYETANAFAVDIQHFLADEAVSASPPGAGYLLRKFARRHRTGLRVAAVIALLLVAGTVTSTLLAVRAVRAERETTRQLNQKNGIVRFVREMLRSPDPAHNDRNLTVAKALDRATLSVETELAGQPEQQAGVRGVIGGSYAALGDTKKAIPVQEQVLEFYRRSSDYGPEHEDAIEALAALAWSYDYETRRKEAAAMQREVLAWYERHREAGHPDISKAMGALGRTLHFDGHEEEGLRLQEEAVRLSSIRPGRESLQTMPLLHWLAVAYGRSKDAALHGKARALDSELYHLCQKLLRPDHPETIRARSAVAGRIGDSRARLVEQREVERLSESVNGENHPYTLAMSVFRLKTMWNAAHDSARDGDVAAAGQAKTDALADMEKLLPRMKEHLGEQHADTLWAMTELASWLQEHWKELRKGDAAAAALGEQERKRALELWQEAVRLSGDRLHFDAIGRKAKLAEAWDYDRHSEHALIIREEILPLYLSSESYGPRDSATDWVRRALCGNYETALKQSGLSAEESARMRSRLVELRKASAEYFRATAPETDSDSRDAEEALALALHAAGRNSEAAPLLAALGLTLPQPLRPAGEIIVRPDAVWKWFHPLDGESPDFARQFAQSDFSDSAWKEAAAGPEGFGYNDEAEQTIGRPPQGKRFTAYFRHTFTTTRAYPLVELRCQFDDGVIAYLDGRELARSNMRPGDDEFRLLATQPRSEEEFAVPVPFPAGSLAAGPHTLAISVHNSGPESSDLRLAGLTLLEVKE